MVFFLFSFFHLQKILKMAKFVAPVIQDNPSGWGPCAVPEQFKDMPYQPFSKGDRLGKVPGLCWAVSSGCLLGPSPARCLRCSLFLPWLLLWHHWQRVLTH